MTRARPSTRQGGFTIMEMMIAMAIVAIMMFITWSVTAQVAGDKKFAGKVNDRNHELRVGMARMVSDISMAYLSANEPTDVMEPRTFFIGKGAGESLLRFSTLSHAVLWANANESEQSLISYFTTADPFDRRMTNLVRRESRRMTYEGWEQEAAEIDILVHDVEKVEFEYWDWNAKEWQAEWDTKSADVGGGRLPSRVRIKVTVRGRDDKEVVHSTQARIMLEERMQMFAN